MTGRNLLDRLPDRLTIPEALLDSTLAFDQEPIDGNAFSLRRGA